MMTLTEKVAYLKGLAEGMNLDDSKNEGKLFKAMIDTLDDMALTISDLEDSIGEVTMQIDEIDDDLAAMEEEWYDDDEDEDTIYEVECPSCGDTICIDEDMMDAGTIDCPGCGENLEFDFDDEDDCCCGTCGEDCDCDHKAP